MNHVPKEPPDKEVASLSDARNCRTQESCIHVLATQVAINCIHVNLTACFKKQKIEGDRSIITHAGNILQRRSQTILSKRRHALHNMPFRQTRLQGHSSPSGSGQIHCLDSALMMRIRGCRFLMIIRKVVTSL